MSDEQPQTPDPEDAELEREVRSQRKFSLDEAIGRAAGDLLKGASPVTRKRQAELAIRQCLEAHLSDSGGALGIELLRRVGESTRLLEGGYERPLAALAEIVEEILGSPERLRRLVRRVDAEWGRMHSQRPYFERGEAPPDAADPYTIASVRATLASLLDHLRGDL